MEDDTLGRTRRYRKRCNSKRADCCLLEWADSVVYAHRHHRYDREISPCNKAKYHRKRTEQLHGKPAACRNLLLCTRATIGEIKIATSPVCTNQGFKSLVCKDGVSNEFMYYLVIVLKPKMIERAIGSTFLEIGKRETASLEVRLPPHDEQRRDRNGPLRHGYRDCHPGTAPRQDRALKQGMMQQLLTAEYGFS